MIVKKVAAWTGSTIVAALIAVATLGVQAPADASTVGGPVPQAENAASAQSDSDPPFGSFLGACNKDEDCSDGNVCGVYKKRGNHCTHACDSPSDCNGTRCTNQNRCGLNDPVKTK